RVLLVMTESGRGEVRRALADVGCEVVEANDPHAAREKSAGCDLILVDVEAHADPSGVVQSLGERASIAVLDGPRPGAAHAAILRAGALDVLVRPLRRGDLERVLRGEGHPALLGDSEGIRAVLEQVEAHARSSAPVVLCGEAETGFESVARLLHLSSDR